MIYLDASVALAQLLAEDRAPKIDKSVLTTGEPKRIRSKSICFRLRGETWEPSVLKLDHMSRR